MTTRIGISSTMSILLQNPSLKIRETRRKLCLERQAGFYQRLIKKRNFSFAFAAARALFRQPSIIAPRLIRALRKPAEVRQTEAEACLMSIAVRPESTGRSIGKGLVQAFCQELATRAVNAVCLTTDRDNNDIVNHFYKSFGVHLHRTYITPEGRAMNEHVVSLT